MWAYITTGQTLQTTTVLNFSFLIAIVGASLVAGRAFCGWMCPLGGGKDTPRGRKSPVRYPIQVPPRIDKWLRYLKYLVLAAIVIASTVTLYPPLRDICPALAIFSFHWTTPLLGVVLVFFVLTSMFIKRFTCRYLCPLGAVLAITNRISLIQVTIDQHSCTHCGRCDNECPVDIPAIPENIRSAECVRCLECLDTCPVPDTIDLKLG